MNKFNLLYFGELDLDNLGEDYFTEIDFDGNLLDVHLNFETKTIDKTIMERINQRLKDIAALDALGKKTIAEDFKNGETVKEYISHHIQELDKTDINRLVKGAAKGLSKEDLLLSVIKLKGIGLYPHAEERFINLDYTIGEHLTDYLIVLDYDPEGELLYITLES